jgi:predicted small secreted protein
MAYFRMFLLIATMSSLGLLNACNTVKGVGQDIEKAGQKVKNSVN